jgi:hypothetical protein
MSGYKDYLARHGYGQPLRIERTMKRGGDVVLGNAAKPAVVAPGIRGRFVGKVVG